MDLSNVAVGQVYGSYRALCSALCINQVTGKSKQLQLKRLSQYIRFSRNGNKYIVEEILGQPNELLDSPARSPYGKLIETLLVARLVGTNSVSLEFTYKQLFRELCMASEKYDDIYGDDSYDYFCNNIAPVSKDVYLDFRRSSYSENKKKIKIALESLKTRMLIDYDEERWVCYEVYEDGRKREYHAKPSSEEVAVYLRISRNILLKYGCDSVDELREKHKSKEFERELATAIKEQLNWKYTYKKIKILNGIAHSQEALDSTRLYLMEEAGKNRISICEEELNKAIKKMINRVGERQHENASKRLEEWERGDEEWGMQNLEMPRSLISILYRTEDSYLPSWNALSEYFISGDTEAARTKAKPTEETEDIVTDQNRIEV